MRKIRIPPAVRAGLALSVLWLLCDIARGHGYHYYSNPRNTLTQSYDVFWGGIAAAIVPSHNADDWLVKVTAMTLLFLLPVFLWWAVRPLLSRTGALLPQERGSGKRV